ncbi:MAG: hypothetical protein GY846_25530 [Deltaproteobacteria bacterium]|nr:hypothetical protein [Deltaproteobacteria bacterium]
MVQSEKTAKKLEAMIFEVVALQKDCVEAVCAHCKSPCCGRVGYLFGEKDILFLKLTGRKEKWRKNGIRKKGCRFVGPFGCTLEPGSRPFICHHYICSDLEAEMKRSESGLLPLLQEKFKTINMLRSQMWAEYLDDAL